MVLFERCYQFFVRRGPFHFRQGLQNLAFGIVDIFQGIQKQVVQSFHLSHCRVLVKLNEVVRVARTERGARLVVPRHIRFIAVTEATEGD